jgi:hypothetical protein
MGISPYIRKKTEPEVSGQISECGSGNAECGMFFVPPLSGTNYIPPADFTIEASQICK